jgi:hypothetical protein
MQYTTAYTSRHNVSTTVLLRITTVSFVAAVCVLTTVELTQCMNAQHL